MTIKYVVDTSMIDILEILIANDVDEQENKSSLTL